MDFKGQVDKRSILMLIGCYCRDLNLVTDRNTETSKIDYPEDFHKVVYGAIYNLAKKGFKSVTSYEVEAEISIFNGAKQIWEKNGGQEYVERAIQESENKVLFAQSYREEVRKYSIIRVATMTGIDTTFIYNEADETSLQNFSMMKSTDVLKAIVTKFNSFKDSFKEDYGAKETVNAGEMAQELLEKFKKQEDVYGFPYQGGYMNSAFKGQKTKKLVLTSGSSGSGKSRRMLGDCCNLGCGRMFNWNTKQWIDLGDQENVIFYSTELTQEELDTIALCHVSGVPQDRLETWDITGEEEAILYESADIIANSGLKLKELPQFSCEILRSEIEQAITNYGIKYVFFDYISECSALLAEGKKATGINLRVDQLLFNLSLELKNMANDYDIHVRSGSQVSANYKTEKDANALKGSKAIIDKADAGMLMLPVTPEDLKKLEPITRELFNKVPNTATYIFKNRGGKIKDMIIWGRVDLGTAREEDLFLTDYAYNLITDIPPLELGINFDGIVTTATQLDAEELTSVVDMVGDFKSVNIS